MPCANARKKNTREKFFVSILLPQAVTLMRHHMFPASPMFLQTAYRIKLLEFYKKLFMTGHLANQAFAKACAKLHMYEKVERLRITFANAFFAYLEVLTKAEELSIAEHQHTI
ncbi:hypothetical protein BDB00DRAFT_852657 [Zychaea mexicana]|uniref:uncharacterized protein n=1 Tax=Zychaea mexicana TaxID=64656 RepID=UPI0022FEDB13|nr:uncharacterized protein BDB00DRAFT_852657 [Zychaea mexicana]KAI9484925.1 hypothetical protein BDB00DRAFT_852657 [Zychaea mexicana]